MSYVNLFGDPVDLSKHQNRKKRSVKEFIPTHSGWDVKGADPKEWRKAMKGKVDSEIKEWYDWARHNNNKKINHKPFSSLNSANDCKRLAEAQGWRNVHIVELKKGDVSQLKGGL